VFDSTSPSKLFKRFLHAYFDTLTHEEWRGGVDIPSLSLLSVEERSLLEELLCQHLELGSTDPRIMAGLGELRVQRAIPALKKRVQSSLRERSVLEPALALWKIAHSQEALAALIEALNCLPDDLGRMDAAINLRCCFCQQAAQALQQALFDNAYLVRYHATHSLLIIYSLWKEQSKSHSLAVKMMSDDPQQREKAVARIQKLIEKRSLPLCENGTMQKNREKSLDTI